MGGEKTEKATPKKRNDARKKGQVLKSTEVNTAFCSIVMFALLVMLWPSFTEKLIAVFSGYLSEQAILPLPETVSAQFITRTIAGAMLNMLELLLPILGTALMAGIIINFVQVGFLFTTENLGMKLNRINPINGFKRMFSVRTVIELLKAVLKVTVLGYIVYGEYNGLIIRFPTLMGQDIKTVFLWVMDTALRLALKMSFVLAIIAAGDYLFQRWKYEKDLRMSKQEIKDEYKMTEGDPQIKGKIRQKQRQMSAMRMMSRVPSADVVITNPTHYAVALKYEEGQSDAPVVIAKGEDYLARKIKEVAREHNIEIVEDKPLAQALYAMCDIDQEIPAEFYQAVADILVFVYRQKKKTGR